MRQNPNGLPHVSYLNVLRRIGERSDLLAKDPSFLLEVELFELPTARLPCVRFTADIAEKLPRKIAALYRLACVLPPILRRFCCVCAYRPVFQ